MPVHEIANPYLEEFLQARKSPGADDWGLQWGLCHRYAWAVPTSRALNAIKTFSPQGIVEIGAGTGYWASLLRQMDVDVIAYDASPVEFGRNRFHSNEKSCVPVTSFTHVLHGGPRASAAHGDRVLMLCWPPGDHNRSRATRERAMSHIALGAYAGPRVIYSGQRRGMLTGSQKFHDALQREWLLIERIGTPSFRGKQTWVYLYERADSQKEPRS